MSAPRIALDAFGGDHCPGNEVDGALIAAREGYRVVLVGDEAVLRRELDRRGEWSSLPLEIHHATDVITMQDTPAKAIRQKPGASMPLCFELVKRGEADAVVSAGNSGAMLACGLFKFGRIKGVERPAIITTLPSASGFVYLADAGANIECRPINLTQFAVMAAVYSRIRKGGKKPRIGILSNGTEASKGTELTRAADRALRTVEWDDFDYVGYCEGHDMFGGEVDAVVADGFTGNIALKVAEGAGALLITLLRREAQRSLTVRLGGALMRSGFAAIKRASHPDYYGGAPLLGVRELAIISHGSSSPRTLATAVELASWFVDKELTTELEAAIGRHGALFSASKQIEQQVAREEA